MDIPDYPSPGIIYTLPDQGTGTITDLDVCVNITHRWPGDLKVTLSHGTTTVVLMDRPGATDPFYPLGCSYLFPNVAVYLDDAATDSVDDTCPLVSNMKPNQPLSAFNGQSRSGTWTLTMTDLAEIDAGILTGVQLYFTTS